MIDFRYHIVSLISVFLALAVGIILGAGPLQGTLGEQLSGQVEQLREERNDLRAELDETTLDLESTDRYVEAVGPELVTGSLVGRSVAVVGTGELDDDWYEPIAEQLAVAGASVSSQVDLTSAWTDADAQDDRDAAADETRLATGEPDGSSEEALATALVMALVEEDPLDPEQLSTDAQDLLTMLSDDGLVDVATAPTAPAEAVLVVVPQRAEEDASDGTQTPTAGDGATEEESTDDAGAAAVQDQLQVVVAAESAVGAVVVAGPDLSDGDLISWVRDDEQTTSTVSSVAQVGEAPGQINVPLALAAELQDVTGQYGLDDAATAAVPPLQEPEEPEEAATPESSDGATGDDGEGALDGSTDEPTDQ
ncbi:hypothetical protein GCM10025865_30700 [Paraoerskovia sediminicola]|uniref:Copper transport outer membrane protein, MctB n=1 Tax=Paraoerskovia sediminicola TaxID=1138587 RepID=A0ABM8G6K9_9CELL|nr:copper transporter [Paraoerskovia sediminicola]BDZ43771.1 hypothetical protein GCM10025865_30700 [Paraoerskovia sediminicola]